MKFFFVAYATSSIQFIEFEVARSGTYPLAENPCPSFHSPRESAELESCHQRLQSLAALAFSLSLSPSPFDLSISLVDLSTSTAPEIYTSDPPTSIE